MFACDTFWCVFSLVNRSIIMSYVTISHWSATEWDETMEAIAAEKFVPMIMSVGASSVQMLRTGNLSMSVITQYADEATAMSAQQKIADIRAQAASEFPMKMDAAHGGSEFASG